MTWQRNAELSQSRRALLAKLVICVGALVALATSQTPRWGAEDEQSLRVALDDSSTKKWRLTIELGGPLYADAAVGRTVLTVTADRAASDLTLAIERLGSSGDGSSESGSDAGIEAERRWVANFTLDPAQASQVIELACPPRETELREETCIDQFEITLARESARPLQAQLIVRTNVTGQGEKRPRGGTFAVSLEEVAP